MEQLNKVSSIKVEYDSALEYYNKFVETGLIVQGDLASIHITRAFEKLVLYLLEKHGLVFPSNTDIGTLYYSVVSKYFGEFKPASGDTIQLLHLWSIGQNYNKSISLTRENLQKAINAFETLFNMVES